MTSTSSLRTFERTLARLMLTGVWVSAACLTLGLAGLLVSARVTSAEALLQVGLVILMATPVIRVGLSVVEAIRQHDWFWCLATIAVMLILTGTMVYSLRAYNRSIM